jgi:hypothetical protein
MDEHRDVGISSEGVEQVIPAFPVAVSFAGGHDRNELWIGGLDARGDGEGSTVQSIEKVALQIMGQFGRLADPGYEAHVLGSTAKVRQGLF